MKYAVDRVENDIIILENIENKEIIELNKNDLNFKVNDGDIIVMKNNKYYIDNATKDSRIKLINDKLNKVKNI